MRYGPKTKRYVQLWATDDELCPLNVMQATLLKVHFDGSHFGPVKASYSQIFRGNLYGLTISQTHWSTKTAQKLTRLRILRLLLRLPPARMSAITPLVPPTGPHLRPAAAAALEDQRPFA